MVGSAVAGSAAGGNCSDNSRQDDEMCGGALPKIPEYKRKRPVRVARKLIHVTSVTCE